VAEREPIPLTEDERRAMERDALLMEAVRRINGPGAPSIPDLFPGAIPVSDLDAAASCGQLHRVKAALNAGAEINEAGPFGTALHGAAENGHLEIVRLLVEHGADVGILDRAGRTARAAALQAGHAAVAEYLAGLENQRHA
jgi:ankyrin repeat protein